MMKKPNLETVGIIAGAIAGLAYCGLQIIESFNAKKNAESSIKCLNTSDGYADAVNAIMDSNMFDSDKREAISALKTTANPNFYSSIVRIASDDTMFGSSKVELIRHLSES